MSPRTPLALALAALAVAAAGCGGDSDPVSTAELIEQGDDLCQTEQDRFREIQVQAPTSASEAVDQTSELIEVSEETTDGLMDIEPPSDQQPAYERYLDSRDEALQLLERGRDAAEEHDRVGYNAALKKSIARGKERQRLARQVGFEVCGEPQGPS